MRKYRVTFACKIKASVDLPASSRVDAIKQVLAKVKAAPQNYVRSANLVPGTIKMRNAIWVKDTKQPAKKAAVSNDNKKGLVSTSTTVTA